MTKEELRDKIIDRINFGGEVMDSTAQAQGEVWQNYDIRILTVYCGEEPITSLRYELEGEKLKVWITDGKGDGTGTTGVPQYDTFEQNLDSVCMIITGIIDQIEGEYTIYWLGD